MTNKSPIDYVMERFSHFLLGMSFLVSAHMVMIATYQASTQRTNPPAYLYFAIVGLGLAFSLLYWSIGFIGVTMYVAERRKQRPYGIQLFDWLERNVPGLHLWGIPAIFFAFWEAMIFYYFFSYHHHSFESGVELGIMPTVLVAIFIAILLVHICWVRKRLTSESKRSNIAQVETWVKQGVESAKLVMETSDDDPKHYEAWANLHYLQSASDNVIRNADMVDEQLCSLVTKASTALRLFIDNKKSKTMAYPELHKRLSEIVDTIKETLM